MFRLLPLLIAIGFCLPSAKAMAYPSGNDLLTDLQGKDWQKLSATRYVIGVRHGLTFERVVAQQQGRLGLLCIPDAVTDGQLTDMVTLFLESNPSTRHNTPALLVVKAWLEFKC